MNITQRWRTIVGNIALLIVAMLVTILLSEGLVRLVAPQRLESYRPIYEPDSLLVYRLKRHYAAVHHQPEFEIHESTNDLGLRDGPIGPKRQGVLRLLGLGDSFSYSNSVDLEDTFFKQLERFQKRAGGPEIEVINGAVPAYSTIQEFRYLERDGIRLRPDVVLLGFYVGNDFQDSYELFDSLGRPTVDVVDGELRANDRFPIARYEQQERTLRTATLAIRGFLASNSALYVFLRERFSETLWRMGLRNNPPPPDFCARKPSPAMRAGWSLTQNLLDSMAVLCSGQNAQLVIVVLPTQYQVHEELWVHHFTTFGLNPADYDLDQPQQLMRDYCESRGIPYVDVLPAMRKRARNERLFYPIASYMTPAGHRAVAEIVHEYLVRSVRSYTGNMVKR